MEAYEHRILALEETVKTLSVLVQGNIDQHQNETHSSRAQCGTEENDNIFNSAGTYAATVSSNKRIINAVDGEQVMANSDNTNVAVNDIFVRLPNENEEANDSRLEKTTDDEFQGVQRKNKWRKRKINIIGDSIARSITRVVKCSEQGSSCTSLRGAGIKQIVECCEQKAADIEEDSLMVIQGGGNSLKCLGEEATVESI